jgi:peptidoglycan/LPS O-acetylase OafA/YrhL
MLASLGIGQLRSLTGLRWVAALLVFAYHVHVIEYFRTGRASKLIDWMFGAGVTGVSFFFILSGFVLAWSVRPGERPRAFWVRRIARIYPVHLVTAVVALLLLRVQSPDLIPGPAAIVANIALVHAWFLDKRFNQSLDPVSWSLACEAFFYAVFPVVFAPLRRAGHRLWWAVATVSLVAVLVVPFFVSRQTMHFVPIVRLPEFLLGVALACLVRAGRLRGPGFRPALAVTVVGYAVASSISGGHRYAACTVLGFAMLITAAATADLERTRCVLRHPIMVRLGELSFAFYMVHILVTRVAEFVLPHRPQLPPVPALGAAVAVFAASLAAAWMLYEWVERPGRDLIASVAKRAVNPHPDGAARAAKPGAGVPPPVPAGSAATDENESARGLQLTS